MKVDLMFICQSAEYRPKKGLVVSNIVDRLSATGLPAAVVGLTVVVRLVAEANDRGNQGNINLRIIDPDGDLWAETPTDSVEFPKEFPGEDFSLVRIFSDRQLVFHQFGRYTFELRADGELLASTRFEIVKKQ